MVRLEDVKIYSLQEASKVMGLNKATIRSYLKSGALKGKHVAGKWWITDQAIKEFFIGKQGDQNA